MRAALLLLFCSAAAAQTEPPCDLTRSPRKICHDFCNYRCSFYNTSGGDTGQSQNLTLYRLTPRNITGLRNKNTADPPGDIGYWLTKKNITRECALNPEQHGCIDNGQNIYGIFLVEVDGKYGPYSQCNPVNIGGPDPVWDPLWVDTRQFACGQNCIIATKDGCRGNSGEQPKPVNGSSDFGDFHCYCDGTGRHNKAVGRASPPFLSGQSWVPASWVPQCKEGYYPAPKYTCLRGSIMETLQGWSFESSLALACETCGKNPDCTGWATTGNNAVHLFKGRIWAVPSLSKCTSAYASDWSKYSSWFGVGDLGGLWYSTPVSGECPLGVPLGTGGCTWREVASRYKNASCVDGSVDSAVEQFGAKCFDQCVQPLNQTSDCYLDCYKSVLQGDAATNVTKISDAVIVDHWVRALQEDEPQKGGCPPILPMPCEGPQCDPFLVPGDSVAVV